MKKTILTMMIVAFISAVSAGTLLLVLSGCGTKDTALKSADRPKAKVREQSIQNRNGAAKVKNILPEGFPKKFPIYPGAVIWQSSTITKNSYCVKWETADSIEKVVAFYGRELPKAGYAWQKTVNCFEYQYFKDPNSYSQVTIISRNSPSFNKKLSGATQIIYSD
ncbi:MAG: hypothetical protein ACM3WV_02615 [Bacillota bacterium]